MDAKDYTEEFNRINKAVIDKIKSQEPTFLTKAKTGYICPFCANGTGDKGTGIVQDPHNKTTPHYTCYVCKANGEAGYYDIIDLIGGAENISKYSDKIKAAADYYGYTLEYPLQPTESPQSVFNSKQGETIAQGKINALQGAQEAQNLAEIADYRDFYQKSRALLFSDTDPEGLEYLASRGISRETAAACYIGYCKTWQSPTAKNKGYNPPPSPRIIIPVSKNFYIARDIRADLTAQQEPYKKQNETGNGQQGLFMQSSLYDPNNKIVFVLEGAIDAMSVIEAGAAAIALNSASNTALFLQVLKDKPTQAHLIIALDNDKAGATATEQLRKGLQQLNTSYSIADITGEYKDANEALTGNREAFIEAVDRAIKQANGKADNTADYINNFMGKDIEEFLKAAEKKTGFTFLDQQSNGIFPGLYCIAAGTSLGKTTFSLQLADQLAEAGNEVIFFSLEQSKLELVSKSLARTTAQIDMNKAMTSLAIRKGNNPYILSQAIEKYTNAVGDRVSIVEGNFNCTPLFIGEYVRNHARKTGKSPIVIIDYLQVLQPDTDEKGRTPDIRLAMKEAVLSFKRLSRELNITVIIISSINRVNYLTPISEESIKEAGDIEYTCDVIWGLQLHCLNEDLFNTKDKIKEKRELIKKAKAEKPRKIDLICLKNRYGVNNFVTAFEYYPANDLYRNVLEGFTAVPGNFTPNIKKAKNL